MNSFTLFEPASLVQRLARLSSATRANKLATMPHCLRGSKNVKFVPTGIMKESTI